MSVDKIFFSPILRTENEHLHAPSKILQGFKSQSQIYVEADSPLIQQSHNTHCIATCYNFKKLNKLVH